MTNEVQNQDGKELAETQHRLEISDPRTDATYRLQTDEDIKAAAQHYLNLFVENLDQKND